MRAGLFSPLSPFLATTVTRESACATISAMMILSLLLVLAVQAEKAALPPGMPTAPGVYYRQGDLPWTKMDSATVSDMKTKGMDTFILTDGYMNLSMTIIYAGSRAPLQIAAPRPVFYIRGAGAA